MPGAGEGGIGSGPGWGGLGKSRASYPQITAYVKDANGQDRILDGFSKSDGLYLFMMREYPYMMTANQVAEFTCTTGQEIRRLLNKGEIQGCRIGNKWLVSKLALLHYLYKRA